MTLTLMEVENNRTGMCVVLCGYKDKMTRLKRADPGLARRFPRPQPKPDPDPDPDPDHDLKPNPDASTTLIHLTLTLTLTLGQCT